MPTKKIRGLGFTGCRLVFSEGEKAVFAALLRGVLKALRREHPAGVGKGIGAVLECLCHHGVGAVGQVIIFCEAVSRGGDGLRIAHAVGDHPFIVVVRALDAEQ